MRLRTYDLPIGQGPLCEAKLALAAKLTRENMRPQDIELAFPMAADAIKNGHTVTDAPIFVIWTSFPVKG